jgi:transcriptional regulator with XRE-family HTH domain
MMDVMASISDRVGDVGGYLREQREHAKLSLRQLAQLAGVSNPYLSQVERGLRKPSAEVLQQIARGLRISAEALYVRAGILESEQERPGVEAAVHADPDLTDRQKRVLLDIHSAFRAENAREAADLQAAAPAPAPAPRRRAAKRAAQQVAGTGDDAVPTPRRTRRVTAEKTPARTAAPRSTGTRARATGPVPQPAGQHPTDTTDTTDTVAAAAGSVPSRRPRRRTGGDTTVPTGTDTTNPTDD